jgi:hypothetical protein
MVSREPTTGAFPVVGSFFAFTEELCATRPDLTRLDLDWGSCFFRQFAKK